MSDSPTPHTVLVLDDEKNIRESIKLALLPDGLNVLLAHDVASAMRALHQSNVDALILDIRLGEIDGIAFFKKLLAEGFEIPTIFISGQATLTEAAQATRLGAFDFLEKPFSAQKLSVTVQRCLEHASLQQRMSLLQRQRLPIGIVGDSMAIRELNQQIDRVAPTNANVLIQGETGTGKELVAATLHARSTRAEHPLIKVNCSAIPDTLLESELFGFEKGAFSGAHAAKKGLFESAHRGTILLDEVADLSLAAQAKILRIIQNGELQKIGSERIQKVDVRILSATHKDLKRCISDGAFREDLYYRLAVVPIRTPSLRERPQDVPLLTHFLLRVLCDKNNIKLKEIDEEVLSELQAYAWPGNVRELQNTLERMLIMSGTRITVDDLPEEIIAPVKSTTPHAERTSLSTFRDSAEREFIIATLKRHHGNVTRAAADLGVGRTYLHRRLKVLDIAKSDFY